ncbi:MAG TPA: Amuc_1100 family pilus-like protein [Terrimicrobiaceae bacterium]
MNWLRENSFVAALVTLTTLGCGALMFLMVQAMTRYQETSDAYTHAVQKLHLLQNRSPFPDVENLEKSQLLKEEFRSDLDALRAQLEKMQTPPSTDIEPQKFQDDLRTAVNVVTEKAAAAGVELPKGFYLGFGQYANSLPTERAAPALARQLRIINKVVTNLIDFRVQSIDNLDRLPLPEESGVNPVVQQTERARPGSKETEKSLVEVKRMPFDLAFTAEQGKLRVAFNALLDADQFLLVRDLTLQNTSRVGPPISRTILPGAPSSSAPNIGSSNDQLPGVSTALQGSQAGANDLNVILGRELVKASMRIEIIDFPLPEQPKE